MTDSFLRQHNSLILSPGFIELLFFSVPQYLWKLWTLSLNILYKLFIFISNSKWGSWLCFLVYLWRCNPHVSSKVFFRDMSIFFFRFFLQYLNCHFRIWTMGSWWVMSMMYTSTRNQNAARSHPPMILWITSMLWFYEPDHWRSFGEIVLFLMVYLHNQTKLSFQFSGCNTNKEH